HERGRADMPCVEAHPRLRAEGPLTRAPGAVGEIQLDLIGGDFEQLGPRTRVGASQVGSGAHRCPLPICVWSGMREVVIPAGPRVARRDHSPVMLNRFACGVERMFTRPMQRHTSLKSAWSLAVFVGALACSAGLAFAAGSVSRVTNATSNPFATCVV